MNAPSSRSALLVGLGIVLSRLTGIVREIVLATWLGVAGVAAEAFTFALGIPKLLQNLLGEGALSASFIPVYSQTLDDDPEAARRLAGAIFGLLAVAVAALVLLLMVLAHPLVALVARGAGDDRADLIASLLRVMAPGIGFIVFAALCLGILNAHRDFFLSYVAPVLWNAAIVVAVLLWATRTDDLISIARAASWGVLIGGAAQFLVQVPRVLRVAGAVRPRVGLGEPAVGEVLRRFVPAVASRGIVTVGAWLDLALASFLAVGAAAVLVKAQTLYLLPISVFAISIAAADLPDLSRDAGRSDTAAEQRLSAGLARVSFFVVFSVLAFVIAGRSIVGALFQYGQFTADDTIVVWLTLAVFALGLLASSLSRLLQNAAYAAGDVAGPARIAFARLVVAAIIGVALMFPADRLQIVEGAIARAGAGFGPLDAAVRDLAGSRRLGAVGLAAGSAVAAWVEFALLRHRLRGNGQNVALAPHLQTLAPAAVCAALLAAVLTAATWNFPPVAAAAIAVGAAGITYVLVARRTGVATAAELTDNVIHRVRGS